MTYQVALSRIGKPSSIQAKTGVPLPVASVASLDEYLLASSASQHFSAKDFLSANTLSLFKSVNSQSFSLDQATGSFAGALNTALRDAKSSNPRVALKGKIRYNLLYHGIRMTVLNKQRQVCGSDLTNCHYSYNDSLSDSLSSRTTGILSRNKPLSLLQYSKNESI